MESRRNSSGTSSQDSIRCSSMRQSQKFTEQIRRNTRKIPQEECYLCRCSTTFPVTTKDNEKECLAHAKVVSLYAREVWYRTMVIYWSGFRKEVVFLWKRIAHKEFGINIAEKMLVEFAESGCPIFRATTPLSRGQPRSKGHRKLSIHYAADSGNDWDYFSHNCFCKPAQSLRSSHGTCVKNMNPITKEQERPDKVIGTINCSKWDQDRSSFGEWWSSISKLSITTIWRTNWEAFTTR